MAPLLAAFGLGACSDKSTRGHQPEPGETKRVLGTPDDAEKLLGSYYKRWYARRVWQRRNPPTTFEGMANIMSLQNYSSLANNCQNSRSAVHRRARTRTRRATRAAGEQSGSVLRSEGEVTRVASNFLTNVARRLDARQRRRATNRDKAFAEFLRGMSLGYVALMFYDSAAVVARGRRATIRASCSATRRSWTRRTRRSSARSTSRTHRRPATTDSRSRPTGFRRRRR